jgi:hypothetical protein
MTAALKQRKILSHRRKKRLEPLRPSTARPSPWPNSRGQREPLHGVHRRASITTYLRQVYQPSTTTNPPVTLHSHATLFGQEKQKNLTYGMQRKGRLLKELSSCSSFFIFLH